MRFLLWSYVSSKQIESYLKCRYELFWIRQDCGNAVGKPRQYDYKARVHLCLGWGDVTVLCDRWKKKQKKKKFKVPVRNATNDQHAVGFSKFDWNWSELLSSSFVLIVKKKNSAADHKSV